MKEITKQILMHVTCNCEGKRCNCRAKNCECPGCVGARKARS